MQSTAAWLRSAHLATPPHPPTLCQPKGCFPQQHGRPSTTQRVGRPLHPFVSGSEGDPDLRGLQLQRRVSFRRGCDHRPQGQDKPRD